jgi:GMP synthase (glutamine-hydrolysing)
VRRKILLYKTGETDPALVPDIGDYERWFGRVLHDAVTFEVHRGFDKPRHHVSGYHGLLITGSPRSLVDPEPWMDDAAAFIRDAAAEGVPVLGVCFGHQLLGHAFGGRVRQNPNGWEVGTVEIDLTEAGARDPLFEGLPRRLPVNQSHRDEVHALPDGVTALASGGRTETQALAVGTHVRGVQFHPEMDGTVISRLMTHRKQSGSAHDTPLAERVLHNFVKHFVR